MREISLKCDLDSGNGILATTSNEGKDLDVFEINGSNFKPTPSTTISDHEWKINSIDITYDEITNDYIIATASDNSKTNIYRVKIKVTSKDIQDSGSSDY